MVHHKENTQHRTTDVLIAGGGPVGLALACELGRRGITAIVVESKSGLHVHPRSTVLSPRTMEYFTTWGMQDSVFDRALPADYPLDVAFTDHLVGREFGRFSYPSIHDMRNATAELEARYPSLTLSRFAKTIIGQNELEPVLLEQARSYEPIEVWFDKSVTSFESTSNDVVVTVDSTDGRTETVTARYLVGCDGGRSVVRKGLDMKMSGAGAVGSSVSIFFRAPELLKVVGKTPAFLFWTFAAGATGSMIAIDGREMWVHSRHLMPGETYENFDPEAAILAAVGQPIDVEVLSYWPWTPRELVADHYMQGRVFLAGDAAHLMSPTGGLGLNTGVGDVVNLAWKLQGVIEGWASPTLLATYEQERRPIAVRNSRESTHNRALMKDTMLSAQQIAPDDEHGSALAELKASFPKHWKHFDGLGLYLGEDYDGSSAVVPDGTEPVATDALTYDPVARPGRRLPHFWVEQGVSVHDLLSPGFTILEAGAGLDVTSTLLSAFARFAVPASRVTLSSEHRDRLGASVVVVRPDGHVAWRGDDVGDATRIVETLRGVPDRISIPS